MTSARNLRSLGLCLVGLGAALSACEAKTVTLGRQSEAVSGAGGDGGGGSAGVTMTGGAAGASAGSSGAAVTAGVPNIPTFTFGPGTLVEELRGNADDENPTLTEDLLQVYFISRGTPETYQVFYAERSSPDAAFGPSRAVPGVHVTGVSVTSPAISLDGRTLWVARKLDDQVPAQYDIYQYTRTSRTSPWVAEGAVAALNSNTDDIPRPLGMNDTVMPLGSRRGGDNVYRLYFARRASATAAFSGAPELVTELDFVAPPDRLNTVDAFLSQDGLTVLFASNPVTPGEDDGDLYIAQRATTGVPFNAPEPISVNTPENDERDPWLSPDGRTLYYVSDAAGDLDIYVAPVTITRR